MNLIREQLQAGLIGVPEALRLTADKCHPEFRNLEYILRHAADAFEGKDHAMIDAVRSANRLSDDVVRTAGQNKLS